MSAGRRPSVGRTRLEGNVESGTGDEIAVSLLPRVADRFDLGMRFSSLAMKAFTDDFSITPQDRADARIRIGEADPLLRELKGAAHAAAINGGKSHGHTPLR